jgi:hypothetical protein
LNSAATVTLCHKSQRAEILPRQRLQRPRAARGA